MPDKESPAEQKTGNAETASPAAGSKKKGGLSGTPLIFLALLLISWFSPLLQKLGFGKLPGDFRFKLFGRELFLPVTTTLLLSLLAGAIAKFL